MKREIERRVDALEADTDAGRIGPLIWLEPGEPVPSPLDNPGAVYLSWMPVQEVEHVETV
ncbi:MAG: hypothetical protein AB7G25_09110 [Sphingomonadaceae bacterium]